MGNLFRQTKDELKQLPLMLGKLAGGVLAVVGFGTAAWLATRSYSISNDAFSIMLLAGTTGVVVFWLSDRKMKHQPGVSETQQIPAENKRMNILAWSLLVLLITLFLLYIVLC